MEAVTAIDPSDDLTNIIRAICDRKDRTGDEYGADDVLEEIKRDFISAIQRKGHALALKQTRRLIALHLRARTGDDDDGTDVRQLHLPGIAAPLPSHINYPIPDPNDPAKERIVTRHTLFATIDQHKRSLELCRANTRRCIAKEQVRERVIHFLIAEGCNSLHIYEEARAHEVA